MNRILSAARIALTLTLLAASPVFASGNGTLPLRLGGGSGSGTLPLKMSGQAQSMTVPGSVSASMVLTQATQPAMDASSAAALPCQITGDVSKHAAQGTITVDAGTYQVTGICYNHETKVMEVVGRRNAGSGLEQSFMTGQLLVESPKEFSGRLTVAGVASHAGRYTFDIKCADVNPR